MMKYLIGRHLSVHTAIKEAEENNLTVIQIFTKSPQQVNVKHFLDKDIEEQFGHLLDAHKKFRLFIHGSYVINFCNPPKSVLYHKSVKNLIDDLNVSDYINSVGVVIHMGKNVERNKITELEAMQNYVNGIKKVISKTPNSGSLIILETGASTGKEIGSKIIDMAKIYHSFSKEEKKRIGFCIDTCHIWVTGYDISNNHLVTEYLQMFDNKIGLDKVVCIQFNDSLQPLGSKKDRHADLTYGTIPKKGLKAMARWANINKIPLIMETPLNQMEISDEFKLVKKWISKN